MASDAGCRVAPDGHAGPHQFHDAERPGARQESVGARQEASRGEGQHKAPVPPLQGYDAYFGGYTVDEASGSVTQVLYGALSPGDVGKTVTREMRVDGDTLTIKLATTTGDGEPVTRTLIWRRSA